MPRFQYHVVNLGAFNAADRMVQAFGRLGEQGWELVAMYDKGSNWWGQLEKGFALFKREVPDGRSPDGPWAQWTYSHDLDQPQDPNWGAW